MRKEKIIQFHKRFANGEQFIELFHDGSIAQVLKLYYWQEQEVFNRILPIVELIKVRYPDTPDDELYGANGIVARLVPIQRAYNNIKNRQGELLQRFANGILTVEDGSIDVESVEQEGISPSKVLVYRQGSTAPRIIGIDPALTDFMSRQEDRLIAEFANQFLYYDKIKTEKLKNCEGKELGKHFFKLDWIETPNKVKENKQKCEK